MSTCCLPRVVSADISATLPPGSIPQKLPFLMASTCYLMWVTLTEVNYQDLSHCLQFIYRNAVVVSTTLQQPSTKLQWSKTTEELQSPYSAALSQQYWNSGFATLRVLSCPYRPRFRFSCLDVVWFCCDKSYYSLDILSCFRGLCALEIFCQWSFILAQDILYKYHNIIRICFTCSQ